MKLIQLQKYGEYSLILRLNDNGTPLDVAPFVVAYKPNTKDGEVIDWQHGHYYDNLFDAVNNAKQKGNGGIHFYRLEEIAGKAIDGLIEDDVESAYEYFANEMELDDDEAEYLGLNVELLNQYK